MFKLGLDRHGVICESPKLFSDLTKLAKSDGGEVHILTGNSIDEKVLSELKGFDIVYDSLFSITDHHKILGTPITYSNPNNPWIDPILWDKTKGDYCKRNKIDFHIDDTERYGEYFETGFCIFDYFRRRFDWNLATSHKAGAFILSSAEDVYLKIIEISKGL